MCGYLQGGGVSSANNAAAREHKVVRIRQFDIWMFIFSLIYKTPNVRLKSQTIIALKFGNVLNLIN